MPGRDKRVWGSRDRERELDQIRHMIKAISQSEKASDDGKCYFLPVQCGVKGSVRGQEYDL